MKITNKESFDKYSKAILPYLKNEKSQNYLTIFLTIGASIFFFLFAINPTLSTISKLEKEISDNKLLDQKMSDKINNLSSLADAYPEIEEDIPLLIDAAPENPKATDLVAQIQTLGVESGLTIGAVNISPVILTAPNNRASSFNFNVTIGGKFDDLKRFTDYLVSMQRALTISSVQITKDKEDQNVTAIIEGTAYFKK